MSTRPSFSPSPNTNSNGICGIYRIKEVFFDSFQAFDCIRGHGVVVGLAKEEEGNGHRSFDSAEARYLFKSVR